MSKVAIVRCRDYDREHVERAVFGAVELLGGISRFIKPGQKVLIKPNVLSERPPEDGVCTHPEVVRAIIRLVKPVTENIFVGDSHGGFDVMDMDRIYEGAGIKKACKEESVKLVKFDAVRNIDGIPFAAFAADVDCIISAPKMKTHALVTLTGAVKNMFGTVVGRYKAECHFRYPRPDDFCRNLVKIFSHVKPGLTIMDGIVAMEGDGPASGKLRNVNLIFASADAVALDAVFAEITGLKPGQLLTTRHASNMGLGAGRISDIEVLGERLQDVKMGDFILPQSDLASKMPDWAGKMLGNLIRSRPLIYEMTCTSCRICEKNCPVNAIDIDKYHIDYSKCIYCFCCHELCPKKSIGIRRPFMRKVFNFAVNMRHILRRKT